MRHNTISLNDRNLNVFSLTSFSSYGTNKSEIGKMKTMLSKALEMELTNRQRECVIMYYYENKKMHEIATTLDLDKSTVSRHIKVATQKLKSIAKYF